jgi:AcrR family transcriptional regulator
MPRAYDSPHRAEQARQTQRRILDAAVEMHRQGITEYEPLAAAAGVSTATVRKHFPNKESIFLGCTAHFFESFEAPQLEVAATLADPGERLARVIAEMCRAHEETHELVWHGYVHVRVSPAIAAALKALAGLVSAAADAVVDGPGLDFGAKARHVVRARVRGLFDTLTYRAFQVHAGFDVEATRRELTALVGSAVGIPLPD